MWYSNTYMAGSMCWNLALLWDGKEARFKRHKSHIHPAGDSTVSARRSWDNRSWCSTREAIAKCRKTIAPRELITRSYAMSSETESRIYRKKEKKGIIYTGARRSRWHLFLNCIYCFAYSPITIRSHVYSCTPIQESLLISSTLCLVKLLCISTFQASSQKKYEPTLKDPRDLFRRDL